MIENTCPTNTEMLEHNYLMWMYHMIGDGVTNADGEPVTFYKLFRTLYDMSFTYILIMDENRLHDGLALRTRYAHETHQYPEIVLKTLRDKPCSVLEMMVALAIRISDIMYDSNDEHDAKFWFWGMISSLQIDAVASDESYNPDIVRVAIHWFLTRNYPNDGTGSLFPNTENLNYYNERQIWDQAMYYLHQYI